MTLSSQNSKNPVATAPGSDPDATNVFRVVETMPADLLTPLSVYLKLSAESKNSFLLESVEGGKSLARYSFIGADPEAVLHGGENEIVISTGSSSSDTVEIGTFEYLKRHFSQQKAVIDQDLPAFIGGAIGFLGFACCEWFEPSLKRENANYDGQAASFMFFRSIVAFDHAKQVIKIISLVFTDEAADENGLRDLYETAAADNRRIKETLEHGEAIVPQNTDTGPNGGVAANWKRSGCETAVTQIKELINAGECYQAVLSQRFTKQTNASPVSIYRAIRSLNPSPYMFLLQFDGQAIVGASPEMLVRCEGERLEYRPIAGTRPRGENAAEDDALAEA